MELMLHTKKLQQQVSLVFQGWCNKYKTNSDHTAALWCFVRLQESRFLLSAQQHADCGCIKQTMDYERSLVSRVRWLWFLN